jgi:hypothetical protein
VGLILNAVKFKNTGDRNHLSYPVIIANVYATPSIRENHAPLRPTARALILTGSGLIGAKKVNLYFDPPLLLEIAYVISSPVPLLDNEIVLRLRQGYQWRDPLGPLKLVGIDTGGGLIKLNGADGIIVADIQTNLNTPPREVTVSQTGTFQFLHPDSKILMIAGTGFNPHDTTLQFGRGGFKEYLISSITATAITVTLTADIYSSPLGNLMLLAVDVGAGFVSLNDGKGVHVATIIPKPSLRISSPKIFRTQTSKLFLSGSQFPSLSQRPQFRFHPPLLEGKDYAMRIIDQNNFELTLSEGRAWTPYPSFLSVTEINVLGHDAGWFRTDGGSIATHTEVVDDDPSLAKLNQISSSLSAMQELWTSRLSPPQKKIESPASGSGCDEEKIVKELKGWVQEKLASARKEEGEESAGMMNELLEEIKRVIREELAK